MIPADTCQIQLVGTAPGGEEFATSVWVQGAPADSAAAANTFAATILAMPTFVTLLTGLKGLISPDQAYTQIRVYTHAQNGTTADFTGFAPITNGVGVGSSGGPLQVACVATLRTNFAGRSYRGRMYFPANGATVGPGHVFAGTVATTLATNLAAWLNALPAVLIDGSSVVVSRTKTTATEITGVTVDNKPDIQRRRAFSLTATTTANQPVGL